MNVFIASDFHIMQHLIRPYTTVLHVCIDFVFSLSLNSLLLDAWFSQIILTWSFPYLEMSAVYRRHSINANTTIDIVYIYKLSGRALDCRLRGPQLNHCTCPLLLLSLFVWHAQRFIRAVDPNPFDLFVHILTAWVSWGWGQKGPKTTLPYIMFVKIICRCTKVLGCDRSCPERRSTSYTPTQTVCGKLVCYWYIYVYQARFILNYRQIDNIYIYIYIYVF